MTHDPAFLALGLTLVAGAVGFLTGWAVRGRSAAAEAEQLREWNRRQRRWLMEQHR